MHAGALKHVYSLTQIQCAGFGSEMSRNRNLSLRLAPRDSNSSYVITSDLSDPLVQPESALVLRLPALCHVGCVMAVSQFGGSVLI